MRLTCPKCQTQYEVSAAAIPNEGREVQCGSCQESWFQLPQVSNTSAPDVEEKLPAAQDAAPVVADVPPQPAQPVEAPVAQGVSDRHKIAAAITSVSAGIPAVTTHFASNTDQSVYEEPTIEAPKDVSDAVDDQIADEAIDDGAVDKAEDVDRTQEIEPGETDTSEDEFNAETASGNAEESVQNGVDKEVAGFYGDDSAQAKQVIDDSEDASFEPDRPDLSTLNVTDVNEGDAALRKSDPEPPEANLNADDTTAAVASAMAALGDSGPKGPDDGAIDAVVESAEAQSVEATNVAAQPTNDDLPQSIAGMAKELGEDAVTATTDGDQIEALNKQIEDGVAELARNSKDSAQEALSEDDRPIFDGEGNLDVGAFEPEDIEEPVGSDETIDAIRSSLQSAQSENESADATLDDAEVKANAATDDVGLEVGEATEDLVQEVTANLDDDLGEDLGDVATNQPEDTIDAIRAALAEDDGKLPTRQEADPTDPQDLLQDENNIGARIAAAGATTAAAAAVVAMPKPEPGDPTNGNNLADRLKARVAEAARARDESGIARGPDTDGRYLAATPSSVDAARAAMTEDDLADGSIPRNERRGTTNKDSIGSRLQPTAAPEPTRSRFTTGVYTALLIFVIGLLLYLFAPQISARVPQAEPVLTSYADGIDGVRLRIAGFLGQGE